MFAPIVQLNHVSLNIRGQSLLKDVNMTVNPAQILTVIGPNGAGKSSLLKIVLGLYKPSSGERVVNRKLRVGYMPQKLHVDQSLPLTVQRFLALAGNKNPQDIERSLADVNALQTLKRPIQSISGGEFQRVLLARALLRNPNLLVLDEPAQGVDLHGQQELYQLLARIRDERQCAILMVSHDLHFVMARTDQVICLNQHVCCSGSADAVANHPEYLALFDQGSEKDFAVYTHHHDHHHTIHGDVVKDNIAISNNDATQNHNSNDANHSDCSGHHHD
ncbi:MAG: zinc ABC transporter ATP-binding protein ZnuC [Moraxellaceae bacterium]|nr:MAG: zinc ABC transporter ATP-binding protein ZnuC [Moraxellaceae bacterium]